MILVTGGCGFIGVRFVLDWLASSDEPLVNLDALTYAARPQSLAPLRDDPRYSFVHGDVGERERVDALLAEHRPRAIVHLAAETHVDTSIADASRFARTNALGTLVLLESALAHRATLTRDEALAFRFLHCSTDEVFGALADDDAPRTETSPYRPRNPYAASKAAADHFVDAFHATHGLPTLVTRGSNTYGPGQHPEKLIALAIDRILHDEPVPLYGDGLAVRDWIYVSDHVSALRAVLERGLPGHSYNVAGHQSLSNVDLVMRLVQAIEVEIDWHAEHGTTKRRPSGRISALREALAGHAHDPRRWIRYVADRPGHDRRYALDDRKLRNETGWSPQVALDEGLRATVRATLLNGATAAAAPPMHGRDR